MIRTAELSECGHYRFTLGRDWSDEPGLLDSELAGEVAWIMCNPSTADADVDDPTIRRIVKFSRSWGYQRLRVVNLAAYRTPNPKRAYLHAAGGPPEPRARNLAEVRRAADEADLVVAAWGAVGSRLLELAPDVRKLLVELEPRLHVLATTIQGHPVHPLARGKHRIPDDATARPWRSP